MNDMELPPFLAAEREALLAEIYAVFAGVSREGGVSWSETDVLDAYGTPEQQAAARARDRDRSWQEVLEDPDWDPDVIGPWSFLDAIGFRYYLPAAMIVAVRQGYDSGIQFHLSLPKGDLRDYTQSKWTLFNLPQRLCIKRFLQYMGVVDGWHIEKQDEDGWSAALKSYWGKVPNEVDDEFAAPPQPSEERGRSPRKSKRSR